MSEDARLPQNGSGDEAQPQTIIVGIGASAGGVKALSNFVEALPERVGAAFVVIAHLDPESRSELAQILASRTKLPVNQVTGTSALKADCVYVIPPDRQLRISDEEISAIPFEEPRGRRMPIDFFFRSLAEQHGDGFAVILTGAGSDGAVGVKAIKEHGGIILVQDPEEAEYPSMPRAAIATEAADVVLPIRQLATRLVELVATKRQNLSLAKPAGEDDALRRILAHLRVRTGHDFTHYKRSTVLRRIARRMQVSRKETFDEYFAHLRESGDEAQLLLADLLISVTTFFRDAQAFDSLARNVVPNLFANKDSTGLIRVWVAGCATGEEAYSIAILLLEEAARQELRPEIQIFATDMDSRALNIAREGRYPAAIEADVSEERLRRFFHRDGDDYRVKRELRDLVLFANHSLLKDPPFSRIDLISCRNLLIYLNRDLQQQVLMTLNYALNRDGYLFLGTSESAEHPDHLFRSVDREARVYQTAGRSDKPPLLPRLLGMTPLGSRLPELPSAVPSGRVSRGQHREALEGSAPPSVLVDNNYRVLHLSENAGRYLSPPGGAFTADVTELVREEIRFDLRSALSRAFEHGEPTLSPALMVKFNGAAHRLYFQVKPLPPDAANQATGRALIFFIEGGSVTSGSSVDIPEETRVVAGDTIQRLQQELEVAHGRLRTMREESEAANEELRAANEELQSINEEYRSTAEELETSKEELQSINEELQTVNSELKLKLDTVSRANSDLQNLMAATDFGTLFLDSGLRIKRFTPRTTELFNITQSDVGRPITDFTHQLDYENLAADARAVLRELMPVEREVKSRNDGWYLVRFRPYRTVDDKIDGVVATFIDITQRKLWEARLRLLLGELTHRVKNILAVVQGMIHQTWRTSADAKDFVQRFDGRIMSLSASHRLLVESEWSGADLRKLVQAEMDAYVSGPERVRIRGESINLPADLATPFGLVVHELATNAIKYGALSDENGVVEIDWNVDRGDSAGARLRFRWQERDGPSVGTPSQPGFGSTLIRKGLPGAAVQHELLSEGVRCTVDVPLRDRPAQDFKGVAAASA
ncbi:MAG: PAS domain-containing protein [Alphaproteobacteria bacterium]|nr:PAS domain-containing protein [Alphaproteobacteria bacterium]